MTEAPPRATTARTRRLLRLTALVSTLDRFSMAPMLVAIAADIDAPLAGVVHATGAYFLAYGLMQPVWGVVSDRLGLVRTLRLTLLCGGLATAVSGLAGSVLALGVLRALAGAFFSAAIPATLVYVGDTVPLRHRQRDVTDLMAGVAVGTGLAAAGAGAVAEHLDWRVTFLATAAVALTLVVALRALSQPVQTRSRTALLAPLGTVLRSRPAWLVLALATTEGAVLLGVLTLLPAAMESAGASASTAGLVTAVYAVSVLACARLTGALSRRVPAARLIMVGASAAVAACVVGAVSTEIAAGVVMALMLGVAWAFMHSSFQTWATQVVPAARAAAVSLFAGFLFVGSALGALLTGGLAEAGRYQTVFLLAAVVAVPLGILGTVGRARWAEHEDRV
jgi:MFS family permease